MRTTGRGSTPGGLRFAFTIDGLRRGKRAIHLGYLSIRALASRARETPTAAIGQLAPLSATASAGVLLVVVGDAVSRSLLGVSQPFFWAGLLVIYVPIAYRVCAPEAERKERLALVVLLGLSLYLVKVLRDPFGFTFADELAHAPNANAILHTHELFHGNSILPATAYYPGLESVTAALASMSGLSSFGAGLVVVGAARLVMMLALFLLFERVSGSPRVAALGATIYVANPNFVFFDAQFSYESLALPLLVALVFVIAEWRGGGARGAWSISCLLLTTGIVATHHLTSYALVVLLFALSLAYGARGGWRGTQAPWRFAAFALLATTAWLTLVASATVGYLTPVLYRAFLSTVHTVSGEAAPRHLFSGAGQQASLLERVVGLGSIVLMAAAFPFGLRTLWSRYRSDPLALLLAVTGASFFAVVLLRFAPAAWETANRSSEFLFLGVGFVLALTGLDRWTPQRGRWRGPALTSACLAILFAGGVIAGWTPNLRLSQPYRISAGSHAIDSEGRQMARWAKSHLGPRRRFAARAPHARLLAAYASGFAVEGSTPDVYDILRTPSLPAWERSLLRENRLRYVVVDRRLRSFDALAGYFFSRRPGTGTSEPRLTPDVQEKFDRARASRLYDSGDIVIFDVRQVR